LQNGQGVPVEYGGTTLKANGTLVGKRLAALVGLRDSRSPRAAIAKRGLATEPP